MRYSIVIPVYDAGRFLRDCLESVVAQTCADFEVLMVDDGSRDDSGKICDEYAAKDARMKVWNTKNGGEGAARNVALNGASGEYIVLLDADDSLASDTLEVLDGNIYAHDLDMVFYGLERVDEEGKILPNLTWTWENVSEAAERGVDFLHAHREMKYSAGGLVVRRSIVEKMELRFEEGLMLGADRVFAVKALLGCERVMKIKEVMYNYRMNVESVSQSQKSNKHLLESIRSFINLKAEVAEATKYCDQILCSSFLKIMCKRRVSWAELRACYKDADMKVEHMDSFLYKKFVQIADRSLVGASVFLFGFLMYARWVNRRWDVEL